MDVIVEWDDGTRNCVCTKELRICSENVNEVIKLGTRVKMYYIRKWYYGVVVETEDGDLNSSDEDQPLSTIKEKIKRNREYVPNDTNKPLLKVIDTNDALKNEVKYNGGVLNDNNSGADLSRILREYEREVDLFECVDYEREEDHFDSVEVSDPEDPDYIQTCEVDRCSKEVFSTCFSCMILLCWEHFQENAQTCNMHGETRNVYIEKQPEEYTVEGEPMQHKKIPEIKTNKRKLAKQLRNQGKQYFSPVTKKDIAGKNLGPLCNVDYCKKNGRMCYLFTNETRQCIFDEFYNLANLQLQREYVCRYVERCNTKQRTTNKDKSRREKTNYYHLPFNDKRVKVCRKLFLSTVGVSEKMIRTSLAKLKATGVVEGDHRGGRRISDKKRDEALRKSIQGHILRFPKVESHYCRQNSSREYLHEDLSLPKMYSMYIAELDPSLKKPSIELYRAIFKSMNLSFCRPKKDQCGLCKTYKESNEQGKLQLESQYKLHTEEKEKVRKIKDDCKKEAKDDFSVFCGCFDLQQVIYLPISYHSSIFYKSRLSVFNLTFYNVSTGNCYCFTWNETESRRGASEIPTCLYKLLKIYDDNGTKIAYLFSDGCPGQNKNSVIASTLLYIVNTLPNIERIFLRFFAPCHGQNEGDSAHSAIGYALKRSGEIFVPSQLFPVFRLARRNHPYEVHPMKFSDFMNFKLLSENLKILSVRQDESGEAINWTAMTEYRVEKSSPDKLFFKTSHLNSTYRCLQLKRNVLEALKTPIMPLNREPVKLPQKKYEHLMDMCKGQTAVIKLTEHVHFYKSLPH